MKGNIFIKSIVLITFGISIGCENPDEITKPNITTPDSTSSGWTTFLIEANNHSANQSGFQLFTGDTLKFNLSFDESAIYKTLDSEHQLSWSKVAGFSDCGTHHHTNSARLVWRWNEAVGIELAGYIYEDGVRKWSIVDTIQPNDTISAAVIRDNTHYIITTKAENQVTFNRACDSGGSYWLYPYFGGQEPAPQQIRIHLQFL